MQIMYDLRKCVPDYLPIRSRRRAKKNHQKQIRRCMANNDQPGVPEEEVNRVIDNPNPRAFVVPERKQRPKKKDRVPLETQLRSLRSSYGSLRKEMAFMEKDNAILRTRIKTQELVLAEVAMSGKEANSAIMSCLEKGEVFRNIIEGSEDHDGGAPYWQP